MKFASEPFFKAPLLRPWAVKPGDIVEVRQHGACVRRGIVGDVMPGGVGFWLKADGADQRLFVDMHDDTLVVWA